MKIVKLELKNLYSRNYDIDFNDDLTILYGLNGSGKTTILNIIFDITQGNFKKVCGYKFEYLNLSFVLHNKKRNLIIQKEEMKYSIIFDGEKVDFLPEEMTPLYEIETFEESESDYTLEFDNEGVKWIKQYPLEKKMSNKLIKEFKKNTECVYIPLNRNVKGVREDRTLGGTRFSQLNNRSNKKNIENSLEIAQKYFERYRNSIYITENRIHDSLRQDILKHLSKPIRDIGQLFLKTSSFDFMDLKEIMKDFIDKDVNENLNSLLEIYEDTFNSYKIDDDGGISILDAENFLEHTYVLAQLNNFKEVSEVVIKKRKVIVEYKDNIDYVLYAINTLFQQTGKKVFMKKKELSLHFHNFFDDEELPLSYLSSGEQQLVIFFIFSLIGFGRNNSKILLVDEPELSLHIEWQSRLLPLIFELKMHNQMIIATHSPDVIGKYENKCVEVRGVFNG
ncbi:AAA family ATPase [Rossellomorea marisflavi]|uniref:AAA family ATPase n=1 Tax=Rossellomorea marisflavi TaxID=189381 RepID=UPI0034596593